MSSSPTTSASGAGRFARPPRQTAAGNEEPSLMGKCFIVCSYIAVAAMFPLSLLLCFKVRALPELIYGTFLAAN